VTGFHGPSFLLAVALLYLTLPSLVWIVLHRRHPQPQLGLWCGGGLLLAVGFVLLGLRGHVPGTISMQVAYVLSFVGLALCVAALRVEAGRRPGAGHWLVAAVAVALTMATLPLGPLPRQPVTSSLSAMMSGWLAWSAWALWRSRASRSARLMTVLYVVSTAVLGVRAAQSSFSAPASDSDPLFIASLVVTLASVIAANIGYVGMALDQARARELQQRAALQALHDSQVAMETAARAREMVANERARTTRLLAHEVRQPLHNAAVALQSAVGTLGRSLDPAEASRAIEQAQGVIRRVSATLDNTVAATALLNGEGRLSTVDADLQVLIDLCLGDLPPEARPRVQVAYRADARSARLEPTLVRLALRNLLTNATLYAPPGSPVELRVLDSDEPLALVLEVADQGPGIPDELHDRIFDEGVRGEQSTVPGYGLGLHVVKRVARLHGGRIDWRPNDPRGSVFRLTLPQGDPG
jgi:signal transduction histidine kinase